MSPAPEPMLAAAHTTDGLHRVETSPAAVPAGAARTPFNSHDEPHTQPGAVSRQLLPASLHYCLVSCHPQLNKSSGLNGEHLVVSTPGMLLSVEGAHLYAICHKDGRSLSPTYAATNHAGQTEGRLQHRTSLPPGQDNPAQPQGHRATPPATPPGSQSPLGGRQPPPGAAQLRGASGAQTLCSKVGPFCSSCDCSGLQAFT
jgi:hypothetical protein